MAPSWGFYLQSPAVDLCPDCHDVPPAMNLQRETQAAALEHSSAHRIAASLRQRLLAGHWPTDRRLPSVRTLARRESVGLGTVQAAYQLLQQEGLVEARSRVGWFVVPTSRRRRQTDALSALRQSIQPAIRRALESGLNRYLVRREFLQIVRETR